MNTQTSNTRFAFLGTSHQTRQRAMLIRILSLGVLGALFLQGCIHAQQPQTTETIHISRVDAQLDATPVDSTNNRMLGSFVIETHQSGAFLEGLRVVAAPTQAPLTNIRIKMAGDDQWLAPEAINIYLAPEQRYQFTLSATIPQSEQDTVQFALSDFRFLTSEAHTTIDTSSIAYSVPLSSSSQQSRS